jgi:hypothetical protein
MFLFAKLGNPNIDRLQKTQNVERLWRILQRNEPATRGPAKKALVAIGAPAVPVMVRALTQPDRQFADGTSWHSKAIRILTLMDTGVVAGPLAAMSNSDDPKLRRCAGEILVELCADNREAARALVSANYRAVAGLTGAMQNAAHPARAARALLNTGDDDAVRAVIAEWTRTPLAYADRLAFTLAMAECGDERTDRTVEWALKTATRVMKLPGFARHPLQSMREGPVPAAMRAQIYETSRLLRCGVTLSGRARIAHEGAEWVLEDGAKRYLLRECEGTEKYWDTDGNFVPTRHIVLDLADDDQRIVPIRQAIERNRRQRAASGA